ncbi:MAG: AAA family ATPase [candidate division WOR-3 bacterium]|nr:AAA family ATPase [candidate division WOR-3 bacterium]
MFTTDQKELARALLQAIINKDTNAALNTSKNLLGDIFGANFAKNSDANGILRFYSLLAGQSGENIPYWGLLYEGATLSGPYENFSLVAFPDNSESPTQILICFGIGTGGVTEDASLLTKPSVQRSIKLLLKLIKKYNWNIPGTKTFVKDNILDETERIPEDIISSLGKFSDYDALWKKYGKYLPSACVIENTEEGASAFLSHILLYGKFREWNIREGYKKNILDMKLIPQLIEIWRGYPKIDPLIDYLKKRKYIILQGPPGTGKTHLAIEIAEKMKKNNIITNYDIIQFHSSYNYEDFVEGIKPQTSTQQLVFTNYEGPFVESIEKAVESNIGNLLIIDEINRGDFAKILGEAIFLLEPEQNRKLKLRSRKELYMPNNFYIIGTMNTADRSIAMLDFAIRRRFAFIDIWPSSEQLTKIYETMNCPSVEERALEYFNKITKIFFDKVTDDELNLQPGHSYFIADSLDYLNAKLKNEVVSLLKEYLLEGKLTLAKNELLTLIEEIEELPTNEETTTTIN